MIYASSDILTTAEFAKPDQIIRKLDLKSGDHVADFGAGHGYFTMPMARAVGGDGKVYAIDIQKSVLDVIRARAKLEHLLNIETIWGDLEVPQGSKLKGRFMDLVVVSNLLFQAENKGAVFGEAHRVLREGGRFAIIEWEPVSLSLGPSSPARVKKETVRTLALEAGFEFDHEFETGSHHYGMLFKKK